MTQYHAVMSDELGEEFGVSVTATSRAKAYEALREDYPESRCVQLESPYDRACRERRQYQRAMREYERGY